MRHQDKGLANALDPVRQALLAWARADADAIRTNSEADAHATLSAATAQAERIRSEARRQGTADADAAIDTDRSAARRAAQALVLRARREAYERLRAAAREKVRALRDEPDFPAARERLVHAVRKALGPEAMISQAADGGVVGVTAGRRLDLSLGGFADRVTDAVLAAEEQS
jgi:vacuolar-type H+-ATPase subunit E/Vma4